MAEDQSLLLQNGTVLAHEGDKLKVLRNHDVLIRGNRISRIGERLSPPAGCKVIDCTRNIVSPGFIDTHHHLWQSQLKGRHGDETLMEYMISGNLQSYNYSPEDIFWGQLAGSLESLDAGVTTVVDHAHMTYSPEHVTEAIRATASSGIRAFFCYAAMRRISNWSSTMEFQEDAIPEWWHETLDSLAASQPFGDNRVHLGLAFDMHSLPKETIVSLWEKCRALGLKLITTHYVAGAMLNSIELLSDYGLLKNDILVSHATGISEADAKTLVANDIFISSTPDTEFQMGLGIPVAFREDIKSHASIGIDCHSNNSSDVLTQLRLGLQHARAADNATASQSGQYPTVKIKLEEAFNLGTIQGAKAVNMEEQLGSITEGKLADIVIFNTDTPSMVCAAEQNPLAAILLHGSIRDINTVIVDGKIRKENGKLCDVSCPDELGGREAKSLTWTEIAERLRESRERIVQKVHGQSGEAALKASPLLL
ncbi:hypothetical protein AJ80_09216 [Polytolypa hystricis UAMH7299]|uniref:Amidohydrolase-related domain-containing protein n=1 Tax=Polytolypa hystricis (strain UAMH7299) TaxID=1447883 RepID=A0A2B7WU83_POLH7|nr:hypothetical protein AJ80_09216 [Polytolypa hystricis UAMH7299]